MHGPLNVKKINNLKLHFCPVHLVARNITALFAGFRASPTCPSDKNGIQVKLSMKQW